MQLFADSQAHFAAVSEDGRLKVWDVDSGALQQELKERDHLSYRYTCLAWSQSSSSSSKSKKRSGASGLGLLALGTSSGQVVVWDLATQEVKHTLQTDGSSAAVQALAFNPQGSLLYSSSSDKYVLEWNLSSAQVERKFRCGTGGASALAVSEDGEVLAAGGSALRTFDLSSGKKSRKLVSGLSSAVTQLKFAAVDGLEASRFLFAATAGARFVNMYDLQLTEVDAPALTFSLPSSAEGLFARASAGEAVALKKSKKSKKSKKDKTEAKPVVDLLVGVTAPAGAMFLWAHKYELVNDTAELALAFKPLPPTLSTAESAGILLAELSTQEDKDQKTEVLVARGSLVKPVFEKVSVVEENAPSQWKKELEFAEISDALLLSAERDEAASKNGSKRQKVEATPADEKTHVPTLSERRALTNSMAVVDETTSFEELNGEEEEEEDNELTLAERVEALRERVESDVSGAISRAERAAEAPEDKTRGDKPDASSLASVLEQALQARDNALLEYCLSARDAKVVVRTVARVSPSRVLALLDVIVKKLERSPNRFARLCPWLRAVLLHHTAYLVAQPDLVPSLSALYQLLESRLQVHSEMQKLAGRLALVLGQIHVNNANNEQEDEETRAAVVYHEGEEEVEAKAEEEIDAEDESEEEEEEEDDDDDGEDEDEDVDVESEDE